MTGLIPRLQSHLVLTALAVLTALWPPIGHPALEVQENRLLLTTGAGRTFHIAPGGNDSADGSALHPWATIKKAASMVVAGDTVHVAAGQYNAPVTTNRSGTAGGASSSSRTPPWALISIRLEAETILAGSITAAM